MLRAIESMCYRRSAGDSHHLEWLTGINQKFLDAVARRMSEDVDDGQSSNQHLYCTTCAASLSIGMVLPTSF